jgi:putative transcriptional regulator
MLVEYARGLVGWGADLSVRVHLEACADCRREVSAFEEQEARLLDELPGSAMPAAALGQLMSRLADTKVEPPPSRLPRKLGDIPLTAALGELTFASRRWLGPGFWIAHLAEARPHGWRAYVLRAPAGAKLPAHDHVGTELTNVLMGSFSDGVRYDTGDFIDTSKHERHSLIVSEDGPCACLVATDGPLRWSGWGAKLISPLLDV